MAKRVSGEAWRQIRERRIQWLVDRQSTWLGSLTGEKLRELAQGMIEAGLYARTTQVKDVGIKQLVRQAVIAIHEKPQEKEKLIA